MMATLSQQLLDEAADFALAALIGGIVVDDSNIGGTLEQPMEVVGVDGYLVVDGGQFVGLSDGVGDERAEPADIQREVGVSAPS